MHIGFHPEAQQDMRIGAEHYGAISQELAQRFYLHLEGLKAEITVNPKLFRVFRSPAARRHFRRPFPYAMVYVLKTDLIWVLAVPHFKQPPTYWLHRLNN